MSRDFDKSQKNTIWTNYYGNANSATDVFGRRITKSNFEADHIWPYSQGGKTVVKNGIPLASLSNEEKSDDYKGIVNNKNFQVCYNSQHEEGVGVLKVNGKKVSK